MKSLLSLVAGCFLFFGTAQTIINKSYTVTSGQKINLKFDYPKNIRISTWDKNEISIQASVTINNGRDDSNFVLEEKSDAGTITIINKPMNFKWLSHSYSVIADGKIKVFSSKEECENFAKSNGIKNLSINTENNLEILMEIKVPGNTFTYLKSIYGMVELKDFSSPATIDAVYGGIDASLSEKEIGSISVEANYGEIFSNLDLNITDKKDEAFHTAFKAKFGTGVALNLESGYGNIYLRKTL